MVRISLLLALLASPAHANWWENPKDHWPETVRCVLKSREIINGQKFCLYIGANNTTDQIAVENSWRECPHSFQCPYNPQQKRIGIAEIINSIKEAMQ